MGAAATEEQTSVASPSGGPPPFPSRVDPAESADEESLKSPLQSEDTNLRLEGAPDLTSAASSSSIAGQSFGETTTSRDRDEALAKVNQDRTLSHIRAWKENEIAKAVNKHHKRIAKIKAWEDAEKAAAEASLKKAEEALEKTKAAYEEKLRNRIAAVHRSAEEKRATAEAKKGEDMVKAEELAAKFQAHGKVPKKMLCCGS